MATNHRFSLPPIHHTARTVLGEGQEMFHGNSTVRQRMINFSSKNSQLFKPPTPLTCPAGAPSEQDGRHMLESDYLFTLKVKLPLYPSWKLCPGGTTLLRRDRCTEREAMAARNQQSSEENPFRSEDDLLILTFKKLWLKKTSMAENLQTVFSGL